MVVIKIGGGWRCGSLSKKKNRVKIISLSRHIPKPDPRPPLPPLPGGYIANPVGTWKLTASKRNKEGKKDINRLVKTAHQSDSSVVFISDFLQYRIIQHNRFSFLVRRRPVR